MVSAPTTERRSSSRQQVQESIAVVGRHSKELQTLLRSRLLIACGVMFGFWAVLPIGSLRHMYDAGQPALVADALIFQTTIGVLIGIAGMYPWRWPPKTLE